MNKVEIARSFSYKLNLGNYQTADFFCSQKAEVDIKDAETASERLYAFCKQEVMKSVNSYLKGQKARQNEDLEATRGLETEFGGNLKEAMGFGKQIQKAQKAQKREDAGKDIEYKSAGNWQKEEHYGDPYYWLKK